MHSHVSETLEYNDKIGVTTTQTPAQLLFPLVHHPIMSATDIQHLKDQVHENMQGAVTIVGKKISVL